MGDFKGDGSLDANFSVFLEIINLFWTSHMSGYLIEPIRNNKMKRVQKTLSGPHIT